MILKELSDDSSFLHEGADKLMFSGVFARTHQEVFLRSFFAKKRPLAPQRIGVSFLELFFAPFVSKKSGVTVYALQNRCKPTEIKTPKP